MRAGDLVTVAYRRYDEQVVPGKRLGRQLRRDSRSLAYPFQAPAGVTIVNKLWTRNIPILDQGNVGSCEGNAETGCAATTPVYEALPAAHKTLNEALAVALYSKATSIDGFGGTYPPDDTGTDSTSVSQAAKLAGLISGYTHASNLTAVLAALMAGPVNVAFDWWDSFDSPASDGLVTIAPGASVRGGHALCARGVDVDRKQVFLDNSWSSDWGDSGSFRVGYGTLDQLMSQGGECVVPLPASQPPPPPIPVPDLDHALWATAGPWSAAGRTRPDLVILKGALVTWAAGKGLA